MKMITPTNFLLGMSVVAAILVAALLQPSKVIEPPLVPVPAVVPVTAVAGELFIDPVTKEVCEPEAIQVSQAAGKQLLKCYTPFGIRELMKRPGFAAWYTKARQ